LNRAGFAAGGFKERHVTQDDLGAALQAMLAQADPVPQAALHAAEAAIDWRDLDSDLALLTSDFLPGRELEHARGQAPRLLVFRTTTRIIELELSDTGGQLRLLGQLDPPGPATVTVQSDAGSTTARADNRGRFRLDVPAAARLRVVAEPDGPGDGGQRAVTEWFRP
jgi:hypothetical protein